MRRRTPRIRVFVNEGNTAMNSLRDPNVKGVLDELHAAAKRDVPKFALLIPKVLFGRLTGKSFGEIATPESMKEFYIPVDPEQGQLLYHMARAIDAKTIVEFGTSFGISTIYLAAAVKDNGGGTVIGTELVESKHAKAIENIKRAGLGDYVDVRLGDALETLKHIDTPVDFVLLDGWKDLYLDVLETLRPSLRQGAVVIADNIFTFKKDLRPYVDYVQSGQNGFESCTLPFSHGFEFSVYQGNGKE